MNFNPFPILKTERLVLRKTNESDLESILFLRSDLSVNKYIDRPPAKSLKDAEDFLVKISNGLEEGKNINWTITLNGSDNMVGSICLWNFSEDQKVGEVGYDLKPNFQGKGIMTEAIKRVIDYGFNNLQLKKIEAYTHHSNESSKKLLVQNNFNLVEGKKDEYNSKNLVFELNRI